jgi:hypothetical protein
MHPKWARICDVVPKSLKQERPKLVARGGSFALAEERSGSLSPCYSRAIRTECRK